MPQAKLWFTSYLHLNHRGVLADGWGRRPYSTVEAHDMGVTLAINSCVAEKDTLVILGDNAFGKCAIDQAVIMRGFIRNLRCKKLIFIRGNHDDVNALKCLGRETHDYLMINWNKTQYFCCHYPLLTWPESHYGSVCVYGHTHATFEAEFDRLIPQRRALDAGWDNAFRVLGEYRPFEASEILDLLKDRAGSFPITERTVNERAG